MTIRTVQKIFDAEVIAASGNADSKVLDLNSLGADGDFSLHIVVTGSGTLAITFLQTNEGESVTGATNFVKPSGGSTIASAFTVTSGVDADGKDLLPITTIVSKYLKINALETSTTNSATITAFLSLQ